jgi:hypothetical protein
MVEAPAGRAPVLAPAPLAVAALVVSAVILVYLGVLPSDLLNLAAGSIGTIY